MPDVELRAKHKAFSLTYCSPRAAAPFRGQENVTLSRCFLHLKDSIDVTLDPEGTEMPLEAVPSIALAAARDCIAGDVQAGRLDLNYCIEVFSEDGELVHTLRFGDALDVALPR